MQYSFADSDTWHNFPFPSAFWILAIPSLPNLFLSLQCRNPQHPSFMHSLSCNCPFKQLRSFSLRFLAVNFPLRV